MQVTIIWSRVGVTRANVDLEFIKALASVMQANYPERVENIIMYPTSRLLIGLWAVVKPWLAPKTRDKMIFAYVAGELDAKIAVDQRTARHGGTLVSEFDHEDFKLTEVEDSYKTHTFTVSAGKVVEEKIICIPGSVIDYEYTLDELGTTLIFT